MSYQKAAVSRGEMEVKLDNIYSFSEMIWFSGAIQAIIDFISEFSRLKKW